MRVFFKTAEFQTHYLQHQSSGDCPGWSYVGIASNLSTGHEVSSAFLSSKPTVWTIAQTVFLNESATADTSGEVEISTSNADGVEDLWSISTFREQDNKPTLFFFPSFLLSSSPPPFLFCFSLFLSRPT